MFRLLQDIFSTLTLYHVQDFTDTDFRKHVSDLANVCHVPFNEHLSAHCLLALVNHLSPFVYYDDHSESFSFIHESILEILMSSFVRRHPKYVFQGKF